MNEDWDDGPYEPTKDDLLMEGAPEGTYRVFNADDSIAAEGRIIRIPHGIRFDPPPSVGNGQRLRW